MWTCKKKQPYVVIAFTKFLVCFKSEKSFVLLLTLYKKVDFMQKKWIQWPHVLIFSTRGRLRIIENELNIAYFSCDIYLCWAYFCKILKTVTSTKRYSHIFQQILLNSMLVYTCYESLQARLNSLFFSLVYLQLKKYHFHCLNKSCTSSLYQLRKNSIGI